VAEQLPPRAIVTAGGTREPIDDARCVTNSSTGRLGAAIARALARAGASVVLAASRELAMRREERAPGVEFRPFLDHGSLDGLLCELCGSGVEILFMAAAVSDYLPLRQPGKIRSRAPELTLQMVRAPKILASLRERCGAKTVLVGFKLLSGVSEELLTETARGQARDCQLDMTVANDLAQLSESGHPLLMVPPEGIPVAALGSREVVARRLATRSLALWLARERPAEFRRLSSLLTELVASGVSDAHIFCPLLDGDGSFAGVLVSAPDAAWESFFIDPARRAQGIGDRIALRLFAHGSRLAAPSGSALIGYLVARGCRAESDQGGVVELSAPTARRDLRAAASVCLVDAVQRLVLIGRRLTAPWKGYWSFPGGSRERDESLFEAALRELEEETGLILPSGSCASGEPFSVHVAAAERGFSAWSVTNFVVLGDSRVLPRPSVELEARWVTFREAAELRPMAAGTRRILASLSERLALL